MKALHFLFKFARASFSALRVIANLASLIKALHNLYKAAKFFGLFSGRSPLQIVLILIILLFAYPSAGEFESTVAFV